METLAWKYVVYITPWREHVYKSEGSSAADCYDAAPVRRVHTVQGDSIGAVVEVLFSDERIARHLSSRTMLVRTYGDVLARRITQRLQELNAADTLDDMRKLPGRCHELVADRAGQLGVHLDGKTRLIFKPADNPATAKPGGGLDWTAVTAIVVIEIVDYH